MVVLRAEDCVSTCATLSPVTTTSSVICPTVSWTSTRIFCATSSTTFFAEYFWNPFAVTTTLYDPPGKPATTYAPSPFVIVARVELPFMLEITTSAPATAAPVLSVTVPPIYPVSCALATNAVHNIAIIAQTSSPAALGRFFRVLAKQKLRPCPFTLLPPQIFEMDYRPGVGTI